jgi:iron complex transport system substrate-binding protein
MVARVVKHRPARAWCLIGCLIALCVWFAGAAAAAAAAQAPARIVSTSPTVTETLFALGLGDRVVGVSRYCRYPEAVKTLPKIGTFLKPDAELIARLRPDLVVIHASHTATAQRLASLSIRTVTVDRGTLPSVFSTIRQIGAAAGVPDRADVLVKDLESRLARVRSAVAGRPAKRVLIVVGRRSGTLTDLIAAGRGTYLHDLAVIAGGVNVLDDPALPEYPRISLETVVRLKPDVLIDAADMGEQIDLARVRQTEALWTAQPLIAGSKIKIQGVTGEAFVTPGPRVVDVARQLARWLHGVNAT